MELSFNLITTTISVTVSVLLGFLVLVRRNKDEAKFLFAQLNFSIALWATANYFSVNVDPIESLFWIRLVLFFAAPQVLFLFLFVRTFPEKRLTLQKRNLLLLVSYTILVMVLTLTPAVFESISVADGKVTTQPGPGIPLFALLVFGTLFGSIFTALRKLRNATGIKRTQWRFINLGLVTWVLLLGLVFILNAFFGISTFVSLSPLFSLIFLGSTFYTIVRHQLLDVRLVITRSIIYAVLLAVVAFSFTFIAFLSGQVFDNSNTSRYIISFVVAAMIVFGLDPLRSLLSFTTDRVFFKAKIDYQGLLQRLSNISSLEINLKNLVDSLERELTQGLKVKNSLILLRDQDEGVTREFRATATSGPNRHVVTVKNNSALVKFLRLHKHVSLIESLQRKIEDTPDGPAKNDQIASRDQFQQIEASLVAPIFSQDHLVAILTIGQKLSGDPFSNEDLRLIEVVTPQIGSAVQKAKLFEEVRNFNIELQKRIDIATEELREQNVRLKQLDQAKSEFVSIASHQLRTPMTGIMGYLSMMTQGDFGKIAPEHMKILTDLLGESQRMIRLINQFLNVSKIEAGKFTYTKTQVQLETLVQHVVNEIEKTATDKGLKLVLKLPKTPLPKVPADADKIEDVILNLIDNAVKYTAEGSLTISVDKTDDHMHFAVKDTGIGIKPADAHELFNKFVRGSGIAQIHPDGSGLGLFIAKSIIDSHGGRIWVDSEGEGKGSTFQFTLPLEPHPALIPAPSAAAHVVKPRDGTNHP